VSTPSWSIRRGPTCRDRHGRSDVSSSVCARATEDAHAPVARPGQADHHDRPALNAAFAGAGLRTASLTFAAAAAAYVEDGPGGGVLARLPCSRPSPSSRLDRCAYRVAGRGRSPLFWRPMTCRRGASPG
jgi:hypothetical protein